MVAPYCNFYSRLVHIQLKTFPLEKEVKVKEKASLYYMRVRKKSLNYIYTVYIQWGKKVERGL